MTSEHDTVRADIAVAEAAALARAGDLAAARSALSAVDSPAALDLLARVHAQSGDLDAAEACWTKLRDHPAAEAAPRDHPGAERSGAEAGLRTIAAIRAHRRLARPLARPSRVAAATAVIVAGAVAAGVILLPPAASARATTQDTAAIRESRRADQLAHQLAANASASAAANAQRHNTIAAITNRLTQPPIPGLLVHGSSGTVEIMFSDGLFSSGERLTTTGRERLRELGARLAGMPGSVTVIGQTVAVPGGPASGGSTVAMSRAIAAAQQLAAASGRPLTAFTLASGDQADPPFPEPARDRTVIVRVSVSS